MAREIRQSDISGHQGIAECQAVADTVRQEAQNAGVKLGGLSPKIDIQRQSASAGALSLHEENVPLRNKGSGSKRLIGAAMEMKLYDGKNISLIDEIEVGLEPHRIRGLIVKLRNCKHALLNLMLSLVDSGDEVVIPTPYWGTFAEQVRLAGGEPVFAATSEDDGFRMTADVIAPAITDRTWMLLLNFPANPTGAVIGEKEIRALGNLIEDRDTFFLWDDTYARLMFEPAPAAAFRHVQQLLGDRFLIAGTASKAYAMTGWRIGWAMGPEAIIKACGSLQSQMTSNASSISQKAALTALSSDQSALADMIAEYKWRANRLREGLLEIPNVRCGMPGGGFYLFPNVSHYLRPGENTTELATELLSEMRVAVVPGLAFGCDGHLRVSFACSREVIEEGIRRVQRFFAARTARTAYTDCTDS